MKLFPYRQHSCQRWLRTSYSGSQEAGWLWSEPDEQQGRKLVRLTTGIHLHIEGDRPPDSSRQAAWVKAVIENQVESISGWVWSALLSFN
jgi:hypothetical protein